MAALGGEAPVEEGAGHEIDERVGDLLDAETPPPGTKRKAEARQGRRDDREGAGWIAGEALGLGASRDKVQELEHGPRPPVHQEEGHGRRPLPRNVQKMEVGVGRLDPKLRVRIQSRLPRATIELAPPILDATLKVVDAGP